MPHKSNPGTDVFEQFDERPTKEKDLVRFLQDRVTTSFTYKEHSLEELGVPRFMRYYMGDYSANGGAINQRPINEVYAYVESSIANLLFKDPYITVNAKKFGTIKGARILEQVINYFWRELKTKEEVELEMTDGILAGEGWHKTGMSVTSVGTGETLKIESERMFSSRVSYKDVVWNIGSRKPPFDCQWMGQRIVKPTEFLKKKYKERAKGLMGGPHPGLVDSEIKFTNFKDDLNFTVYWEIWDAETKKIYLIADNHERFLTEPKDWPDYMDEFPFNRLKFANIPDEPWGMPDIKPWEPQILETIKLVNMLLNHVKRWNRQAFYREGSIEPRDLDKMEKGVDGSFIPVKTQGPISEAFQPMAYATFQPEVFQLLPILDQIKKNIHGQPSIDRGAPEKTGTRTLGELNFIRQGARSRTDRKQDKIETHIENIARHMIAHVQANFDLQTVVSITGDQPEEVIKSFGNQFDPETNSISFSKDDIIGEYDVEVKAGSTLPLDKTTRRTILTTVLEVASKFAGVPNLPPFIQTIITELLQEFGIKSLEQAFQLQQEAEKKKAQAAAQAQQADVEKDQADAEKRRAQANQIKSETGIKGGEALLNANKEGVLPEAIALARGFGTLPDDD